MVQDEGRQLVGTDDARLAAVCAALGVRLLVLFGSRATGSPPPGPDSDLDLAISLADPKGEDCFSDIHSQLARAFPGDSIDLAFLRNADPLFRWEIVRDGRLLWGDPVDFLEYRAFAFRDYVDSADLRALERALFLKKMAMIHRVLDAAA